METRLPVTEEVLIFLLTCIPGKLIGKLKKKNTHKLQYIYLKYTYNY